MQLNKAIGFLVEYGGIMGVSLRKISEQDISNLTDIFIATYSKPPWNENWSKDIVAQRIEDYLVNPIALNYILYSGSEIFGALFGRRNFYIDKKELFVDEFFINYKYQKNGYGSLFIDLLSKELIKDGYSCIVLNTEKDYPSEYFYKKNGFARKDTNIFMYKEI